MKNDKFFPINTDTACRLKWAWSTLYLNSGITASCHRSSWTELTEENFSSFHNLPNKLADRQAMLEGKWPGSGCEYCKNIEANGGISDRQFQLSVPNVYPRELDTTIKTDVHVSVLEVYFKNTCNLKCLYCTERLSSSIAKENKEFGVLETGYRKLGDADLYDKLAPLFWEWLENNFQHIQRLHILGGEPFIQDDLDKLLDFIDEHDFNNIEFNVISNLMIKERNLVNYLTKIEKLYRTNKIKRFDLNVSVDCWGPSQEYIRTGFNCDQFEKNMQILLQHDWIRIGLLSTVTSLSIPTMNDLYDKIVEWNKTHTVYWYFHYVLPLEKHVLAPHFFDYELWRPHLESLHSRLTEDEVARNLLNGIMAGLKNSNNNAEKINNVVSFLNQIDSRRNLNWKSTFKWLDKIKLDLDTDNL